MKKMIGVALVFMLLFCIVALAVGCQEKPQAVETNGEEYDEKLKASAITGTYVGLEDEGVICFKGIPYAKPPVGDLRWQAPEQLEPSDEIVEAYDYGKSSIQYEWFSERASYNTIGEDCLTLNVWTSDINNDSQKPVMVFFHGGDYAWGGTSDPLYDGKNFVKANDDVILVTANYRLGLMGFIDFSSVPGGENFEDAPDLALLDHIAALEWVQKNISAFGGDPDNVTIFGQSAGGGSTSVLLIVDEAEGLFQRCISQSGSLALTSTKESCQTLTQSFLEVTGAKNMDDLMALTEEELIHYNELELDDEGNTLNDLRNMPMRGSKLVPEDVYGAMLTSWGKDVDLMIGTTADEYNYWIGEMEGRPYYDDWIMGKLEQDKSIMNKEDQALVDKFLALQSDKEEPWKTTEFYNEMGFRVPACIEAANHAAAEGSGNTYMYYITIESSIEDYHACHAVELSYVFNNLQDGIYAGEEPQDPVLGKKFQKAWTTFATNGIPIVDGVDWPQYESRDRTTMIMGSDDWFVENDPLKEQRILIEKLIKYHNCE